MIINEFVIEFPEFKFDKKILDLRFFDTLEWFEERQANAAKVAQATDLDYPGNIKDIISHFDLTYFMDGFIAIEQQPGQSFKPHRDTKERNCVLNFVIQGEDSVIRFHSPENLNDIIFEYTYKDYPVLINTQQFHSAGNFGNTLRRLISKNIRNTVFSKILEETLKGDCFILKQ